MDKVYTVHRKVHISSYKLYSSQKNWPIKKKNALPHYNQEEIYSND